MRKLLLALALFPALASVASADGVVRIQNQTSDVIRYNFKWGNSPWRVVTLNPGQAEIHRDFYNNVRPEIEYSVIVNNPGTNRYEMLEAYTVVPGSPGGKVYSFFQTPQDRRVYLTPQN